MLENRCSDSTPDSGERIPSNCVVNGMVSESQGCGRVMCLFYEKKKTREVEEPLFFEPLSPSLPRIEKGALIEIIKGAFGLPDSSRGWWKELRDTLQRDSWNSLKLDPAFFCLRDLF